MARTVGFPSRALRRSERSLICSETAARAAAAATPDSQGARKMSRAGWRGSSVICSHLQWKMPSYLWSRTSG
eukprot:2198080-Alexandrium_andersonii.AAC.1